MASAGALAAQLLKRPLVGWVGEGQSAGEGAVVCLPPVSIARSSQGLVPASRPPSPYRLLASGEHYDVWRRPADPEGKPVLHHMALGEDGAIAAVPNCSEVVGLGLLAFSNQLGLPPQSIAILGAAPDRATVAVPPGEERQLCSREWDWIEAVGRG